MVDGAEGADGAAVAGVEEETDDLSPVVAGSGTDRERMSGAGSRAIGPDVRWLDTLSPLVVPRVGCGSRPVFRSVER